MDPASQAVAALYISSISAAQVCSTILRFTFIVGVSSPDSMLNSRGSRRNFLSRSNWASSWLSASTISS